MSVVPSPKIGVLLTFANEEDPQAPGGLPQLPPELVDVDQVFEDAEGCRVVLKPGLTYKRFTAALGQVENLRIFHYSGHASSDGLWLLNEKGGLVKGHVKGIVKSLEAFGVKLAFLNGCSTEEQVRFFHKGGIPVVISTLYPVADLLARHFATFFYRALVRGKNLKESFEEAEKALLAIPPEKRFRERGFVLDSDAQERDHPYQLHIASGQEGVGEEGLRDWLHDLEEKIKASLLAPTVVGKVQQEELTPSSYLRCDRRKETEAFEERVDECVQSRCEGKNHEPLVLLIRGPKDEMPESLATRYFEYTLEEAYARYEGRIQKKRLVPIYFPTREELAEEPLETALMLVEKPFRKEFNLPRRGELRRGDILQRAGKNLDLLLIHHDLEGGVSENLTGVLSEYTRRHWQDSLDPGAPQVLVVFTLAYPKATFLDRLGRRHKQLEGFIGELAKDLPNLLLLPPLESVSKADVQYWQRKYLATDPLWVDGLFGKKKRLPMRLVQQKLQNLTDNRLTPI